MTRKRLPPSIASLLPESQADADRGAEAELPVDPGESDFSVDTRIEHVDFCQSPPKKKRRWRTLAKYSDGALFPNARDYDHLLGEVLDYVDYALKQSAAARRLDDQDMIMVLTQLLAAKREIHGTPRPRLAETALPDSAPEAWTDRDLNKKESPVEFVRRVYRKWLGKGMTRRQLRALDIDLYRALSVWMHRHPEDELSELASGSEHIDAIYDRLADELSPDDLKRLSYAIDARTRTRK